MDLKEQPRLFPPSAKEGDGVAHPPTGIMPYQTIAAMVRSRVITAASEIRPDQIQPASIDLRLGRVAYRVRASFLPGRSATVMGKIERMDGLPPLDLSGGTVLERGCVYVVPLLESIKLPAGLTGIANPKSSTGRLDVLTRLITDNGTAFDRVGPGYEGPLYIEIAPQTFPIIVREGSRLNQMRFQRGVPKVNEKELTALYDGGQLVWSAGQRRPLQSDQVPVTIDLRGRPGHDRTIGYRARKYTEKIDIDTHDKYEPDEFWDRIECNMYDSLVLDPDNFYVLATCEEVGVPPHLAAEMVPYYTSSGEYRVHYAGFFDPGFGWREGRGAAGSKAVLEVRSYVPFMLEHGQTVGWLRYMRMAWAPERTYGEELQSSYQNQGLALSRHFKTAIGRL
jgi:dCTP deaminase